MADYQHIQVTKLEDGRVLELRLASGKGNILGMAMMAELEAALVEHEGASELALVVFSGSPGCFSFGASVEEHKKEQAPNMLRSFHRFIRKVARYPVPTAALVEGPCLGGAFELVLACQMVFGTSKARFACPEVKLGVFPPVLAALGPGALGRGLSDRLLLTGADLDCDTALRVGWLAGKLDDADPRAAFLAWYRESLAPLSAYALRQASFAARSAAGIAALLGEPLDRVERHYLEAVVGSHDGNEGIEAFLARRKPVWKNA